MDMFNNRPEDVDKLSSVRGKINDTKSAMVQNIEKILERGEKIEILVDKSERLDRQANNFRATSKKLRNHYWWANCKYKLMMCFVLVVVVFVAVTIGCGGLTYRHCQ